MQKLAVIFGGPGPEHEVSLSSARSVMDSALRADFELHPFGIRKDGSWVTGPGAWDHLFARAERHRLPRDVASLCAREEFAVQIHRSLPHPSSFEDVDVALPLTHGNVGEDGTVQGLFDLLGIPIAGCGVHASAVCFHKPTTKAVLRAAGLPVAKEIVLYPWDLVQQSDHMLRRVQEALGEGPYFVKPASSGSSTGTARVPNPGALAAAIAEAAEFSRDVLVEPYIEHREMVVGIIGNDGELAFSAIGECLSSRLRYDYDDKYLFGNEDLGCPAQIDERSRLQILDYAQRAYRALGCQVFSRVDLFIRKDDGAILINEVNTIPGFTSMSVFPRTMAAVGIDRDVLVQRLVELALARAGGR